jgi:hypothetical protein
MSEGNKKAAFQRFRPSTDYSAPRDCPKTCTIKVIIKEVYKIAINRYLENSQVMDRKLQYL